jgi:hypothetical protein
MLVLIAAALLSGCATAAPFENLAEGSCSNTQAQLVNSHITQQIAALEQKDWVKAYSFAAASFQKNIDLAQFTQIIESQYFMLINNEGFDLRACEIMDNQIIQLVAVKGVEGNFILHYALSLEDNKLGIVAALINAVNEDLSI